MDKLPVYYGWSKLNGAQKREALAVIFLNAAPGPRINKDGANGVTRYLDVVYTRYQTADEMKDAAKSNRIYTRYELYLDDKNINGSLDALLYENYKADENNVSKPEREKIKAALKARFLQIHKNYQDPGRQLQIDFKF